jgi:hypothetical protein
MCADLSSNRVRATFQEFLNLAITQGRIPAHHTDLGPDTWAALDWVAGVHPEATPQLITDAYNAFIREHGPLNRGREPLLGGSSDFVVRGTKECHPGRPFRCDDILRCGRGLP